MMARCQNKEEVFMNNQSNTRQKGLSVKDLVTIGIFSALFFIFTMIGGAFFAVNPVLTFYMPLGSALLAAPIYLLLIAKVHKRFCILILGVIMAIIWFVTGMHWAYSLSTIIMAIVSEIVTSIGQYKSKLFNSLSYMTMALGSTGSYIAFFINPNAWATTMLGNGTEQSYIDTMMTSAHSWVLVVMIVGTLVVAGISALIGNRMLKKQFEKAGII